jgi:hypothetical protein
VNHAKELCTTPEKVQNVYLRSYDDIPYETRSKLSEEFKKMRDEALEAQCTTLTLRYEEQLEEQREAFEKVLEKSLVEQAMKLGDVHKNMVELQKNELNDVYQKALADRGGQLADEQKNALELQKADLGMVLQEQHQSELKDRDESDVQAKERQRVRDLCQLTREMATERDRLISDLEMQLEEETEAKETAESALAREVSNTDECLDRLRDRIEEGSNLVGFQFPTAEDMDERIYNLAFYGKLCTSRMYRRPFEQLSKQLGIELEDWPSLDLPPQEHNTRVRAMLDDNVADIVRQFERLHVRVAEAKQQTKDVRASLLHEMLDGLKEASVTIEALKAQLRANDELWAFVKAECETHFGEVFPQLVAVSKQQTAIIEEQSQRLKYLEQQLEDGVALVRQYAALVKAIRAKLSTSVA